MRVHKIVEENFVDSEASKVPSNLRNKSKDPFHLIHAVFRLGVQGAPRVLLRNQLEKFGDPELLEEPT